MEFLQVSTTRDGSTVTISVSGELDIATAEPLRSHLLWLLQDTAHGHAVILDLSRVSFIDASGLGVLVSVHNQAQRRRTPLRLAGVPATMRRLLSVTGLDAHLHLIGAGHPHR